MNNKHYKWMAYRVKSIIATKCIHYYWKLVLTFSPSIDVLPILIAPLIFTRKSYPRPPPTPLPPPPVNKGWGGVHTMKY